MPSGFASAAGHQVTARPSTPQRKPRQDEPRIPHRVPCRVKLYSPQSGQPTTVVGLTTNISSTGLAIQVARDVPAGTWVEALVPHTNGNPMFFCGSVVRSRRVLADTYEIGIEFDAEPPTVF